MVFRLKFLDCIGFHSHKVQNHFRGANVQAWKRLRAVQVRHTEDRVNLKRGADTDSLYLRAGSRIKVGDAEKVIIVEYVLSNTQLLGSESRRSDAPTLAVASIPHLCERLQQMASRDFFAAGNSNHSTAALRLFLSQGRLHGRREALPRADEFLGE